MLPTLTLFWFIASVIGSVVTTPLITQDILMMEGAAPSNPQNPLNALSVKPLSDVAALQLPQFPKSVFLFYQDGEGNILQHTVSGGPFTIGYSDRIVKMVHANYTRRGTSIVVSPAVIRTTDFQMHVYYITSDYTIGELRFIDHVWACPKACAVSCSLCIDNARYKVSEGTRLLYALQDEYDPNTLRVGFESPGFPDTISEAVTMNMGRNWHLAPLPNQKT